VSLTSLWEKDGEVVSVQLSPPISGFTSFLLGSVDCIQSQHND